MKDFGNGEQFSCSPFHCLETFLKQISPFNSILSNFSFFLLGKQGKSNRAFPTFSDPSTFRRSRHYKIQYSRTQRTSLPSLNCTTQWYLMLTNQHNSISPCRNSALWVTSTVNQGRTPLLQDKIRKAWSAQQ